MTPVHKLVSHCLVMVAKSKKKIAQGKHNYLHIANMRQVDIPQGSDYYVHTIASINNVIACTGRTSWCCPGDLYYLYPTLLQPEI